MNKTYPLYTLTCLVSLACLQAHAEAVTDGTMGAVTQLNGNFTVPQDLGTLKGQNLFHSFGTFNVQTGESATFTGNNAIKNVISRVTGDEASNINGLLRSQVGQADFYFINPNGVTFGAGTQIDVPAALKVSTASEIQFPDGGVYSADLSKNSSLSAVKPEAFGFLGDQSGQIELALEGGELTAKPGATVELVGRGVTLQNSTLTAEAGNVRLEAVGSGDHTAAVATASDTAQGNIQITDSTIDVSGDGAGKLVVRGGDVTVSGRQAVSASEPGGLLAQNTGDTDAGASKGIDIKANTLLLEKGGRIRTNPEGNGKASDIKITTTGDFKINASTVRSAAFGNGSGGDITINAKNLTIDTLWQSEAAINTNTQTTAAAGNIKLVIAESITLRNLAYISSDTYGAGNTGGVTVNAGAIKLESGASIETILKPNSTGNAGNIIIAANQLTVDGFSYDYKFDPISSSINSGISIGNGQGGDISITATDSVSVTNGGKISTSSLAGGNAGNITIDTNQLTVDGFLYDFEFNPISSSINSSTSLGNGQGGDIRITATDSVSVTNGGDISSKSLSADGDAGNIDISTSQLIVDGYSVDTKNNPVSSSGIRSGTSSGTGQGGDISITATGGVSVTFGGEISSQSLFADGNAGNIGITTNQLKVDGYSFDSNFNPVSSSNISSGTSATAENPTKGQGGDISITATDNVSVTYGGEISSQSLFADGNAGNIDIKAGQLELDYVGTITSGTSGKGNGGNILVSAPVIDINHRGLITSSSAATATGNAGTIKVDNTGTLTLANGGTIKANAGDANPENLGKGSGNAGNVVINTSGAVSLSNFSGINADTYGTGSAGQMDITAGSLLVDNSLIDSSSNYQLGGRGGDLNIAVVGDLSIDGGVVSSSTASSQNSGAVQVSAHNLINSNNGGITSETTAGSTGNAGNITIAVADRLALSDGGAITSSSEGFGTAGDITINAGSLAITNAFDAITGIASQTVSQGAGAGDITASITGDISMLGNTQIASATGSAGNAGNVTISADALTLKQDAQISSSTFAAGDAGDVTINANNVTIDGQDQVTDDTLITSGTVGSTGKGGNVTLKLADTLTVTNGGGLSVETQASGDGGELNISAKTVLVENTGQITSSAFADGNAGNIKVTANKVSINQGGQINASTSAAGNAGDIDIVTANLAIDGQNQSTGISSTSISSGNSGNITVEASDTVSLVSGGGIDAFTSDSGNAGNITVKTGVLTIDGQKSHENFVTGILSEAGLGSTGNAGNIQITADQALLKTGIIFANNDQGLGGKVDLTTQRLSLTEGAGISTTTLGSGAAGDINIHSAEDVLIDGVSDHHVVVLPNGESVRGSASGIYLNTLGTGNGGNLQLSTGHLSVSDGGDISAVTAFGGNAGTTGGNINIHAQTVALSGGASVSTSTSGAGRAGLVNVVADQSLHIAGAFDRNAHSTYTHPRISDHSGITSNATRALNPNATDLGAGGTVKVTTPLLVLSDGGEISVTTEGANVAGTVAINAATLALDNASITSAATRTATGDAGAVLVKANTLNLRNDSQISSSNQGSGDAGVVNVTAQQLTLDQSQLSTTAVDGQGGPITVNLSGANTAQQGQQPGGNALLRLNDSEIITSVTGKTNGNGGDITINGGYVLMDTGMIQANTAAPQAQGGNVNINVKAVVPSGSSLQIGGAEPLPVRRGEFGYNVIQAAAPDGVNGAVKVNSPQLDLSGTIATLSSTPFDASKLSPSQCVSYTGSSLTLGGQGGLPPALDAPLVMP